MKRVLQKPPHDVDENLLHEALCTAHPGVAFVVESDPDGAWVAVTHPDDLNIEAQIAGVTGKRKLTKRDRDRATFASLGSTQARVDFLARHMGLID